MGVPPSLFIWGEYLDSIQHAAHGYIAIKACELITGQELPWTIEAAGAVIGASHDIIGFAEKLVKRNWNAWNWYSKMHSVGALFFGAFGVCYGIVFLHDWVIAASISFMLHIVLDMRTHEDLGATRNWYPPDEMWREDFWKALAWCWPNWIGWGASVIAFFTIRHWGQGG